MFLEKFLFYTGRIVTTELPNLVPQRFIDDFVEIHILHLELCDPLSLDHQFFRSRHDRTGASFARDPKQIPQFRSFGK